MSLSEKLAKKLLANPKQREFLLEFLERTIRNLSSLEPVLSRWESISESNIAKERSLESLSEDERIVVGTELNNSLRSFAEDIQHHIMPFDILADDLKSRDKDLQDTADKLLEQSRMLKDAKKKEKTAMTPEQKRMKKLILAKKVSSEELFDIINLFGHTDVERINHVVKGKVLRGGVGKDKGRFMISAYHFRQGFNPYITLEKVPGSIELKSPVSLNSALARLVHGAVTSDAVTLRELFDLAKSSPTNLQGKRLVYHRISAKIDGVDGGKIHLLGYPSGVWISLKPKAVVEALKILHEVHKKFNGSSQVDSFRKLDRVLQETPFNGLINAVNGITISGRHLDDYKRVMIDPNTAKELGIPEVDHETADILKRLHEIASVKSKIPNNILHPDFSRKTKSLPPKEQKDNVISLDSRRLQKKAA